MKKPLKLIYFLLAIEILAVILGIFWHSIGPEPFTMSITEENSEQFKTSNNWNYMPILFPTGSIHSKFALNMTLSATFNMSEARFDVYLFNSSQFLKLKWGEVGSEHVFLSEFPNYNFSIQVPSDDYVLAINSTEKTAVSGIEVNTKVGVFFQNFDYSRVWPSFFLLVTGLVTINLNIILMKKLKAFRKIDSFFRRRFVIQASFQGKKAYASYALETYEKFTKPLISKLVLLLPILLSVLILIRSYPQGTSPFVNVAFDYTAWSTITAYLSLLLIIPVVMSVLTLSLTVPTEISMKISDKLSLLRRTDVKRLSDVGVFNIASLRKRRYLPIYNPAPNSFLCSLCQNALHL